MDKNINAAICTQAKQILKSIKINLNMINKLDKHNFFSLLNKRFLVDAIVYENYQLVLIGLENLEDHLKLFTQLIKDEKDEEILKTSKELIKSISIAKKADPITIKGKIKALSKKLKAYENTIITYLNN